MAAVEVEVRAAEEVVVLVVAEQAVAGALVEGEWEAVAEVG